MQTAIDRRKIPRDPQSGLLVDNTNLSLSPKIVLAFPRFPGGVENTYSQFSRKLFNHFENCLRILIKVLEFYEMCAARSEVAAQLSLYFPGGKCHLEKLKKKTFSISDTNQPIFIKFSLK